MFFQNYKKRNAFFLVVDKPNVQPKQNNTNKQMSQLFEHQTSEINDIFTEVKKAKGLNWIGLDWIGIGFELGLD